MAERIVQLKAEIIDKVCQEIDKNISGKQAGLIKGFVQELYGTVAYDDLQDKSIGDLYGSVMSFWRFVRERQANETKVRVYNPTFEQHGWQSTHTIIEVITDDIPFLVDSIRMEVDRHNLTTHLIIHYGGLHIQRDDQGVVTAIENPHQSKLKSFNSEAPIYLEIDRQTDTAVLDDLYQNIQSVLNDTKVSVEDWPKMCERVRASIKDLDAVKEHLDPDDLAESKDFLRWIEDHHFTFLGVRDYSLEGEGEQAVLKVVPNSGYGVLRDADSSKVSRTLSEMTPEACLMFLSNRILIIAKSNTQSSVHRPVHTDSIHIMRHDKNGKVIGERRIIGLFTSTAYHSKPDRIPYLRHTVAQAMKLSNVVPKSHAGKVLLNILETLPRDDLFQASPEELLSIAMGIFHLQERRRIKMFARRDVFGRFISCLVYVPRDRFNTELRLAMQNILAESFHAEEITFSTHFSDSILARIHFVIRVDPKQPVDYDHSEIENKLIEVARSWQDELCRHLIDYFGEERGNHLVNSYANAFSASFKEDVQPRSAVYDIKYLENLQNDQQIEMNVYQPVDDLSNTIRFKIYRLNETIPLSDALPILENMGLRVISEQPYEVMTKSGKKAWINDFAMQYCGREPINLDEVKDNFQQMFYQVWHGFVENDSFNRLVLSAGITWQQVTMLRAYAHYLRQVGFTLSQQYMQTTLNDHVGITKNLVDLFLTRFDPKSNPSRDDQVAALKQTIIDTLEQVPSLDDDRILRRYLSLIQATLRTNFFQSDKHGAVKPYLSLKLKPALIPELPLPLPMFEIFVYSPRFEGVHLRGGPVSRGGLRWSDRPEDFRTEILGLMKAQQVKNAVIVPTGAKGGFVPKCLPVGGSREQVLEEGINCYTQFISGLLDITDNMKGDSVIKPKSVYSYDGDDAYLVVAADKGTATFSDIANGISKQYGFWLNDAFASGGSAGYDHKKMGITARGAWESVKRHFRELGINTQTTDFTAVGIGDMAGDVFGNGMLLSRHIRLVAAFNHMHIFVDPNPNAEQSFEERERLFNLPRSGWDDYNEKLISKGGGIFSRQAKSIPISAEMKQALSIEADQLEPNQLMRAILQAPVDLLWNGGIGTFVKGIEQTNADAGDRANDAIRINANELRCKVVGEGGNLGLTQQARVEYALAGGLIFTDFIDNSAGVDCSDHEVNIKILLNDVVQNGDMTEKQRNALLASMTDEVAELVLRNNYEQTQAISLAAAQAARNVELHGRYIRDLERTGKVDRQLEFLPDDQSLMERKLVGKGLARPGIAVLLAYSKILLKEKILETDVPEDPFLAEILAQAFPKPLREKYRGQMNRHRLRREIIATQLSNDLVNEMGFTFVYRLVDETGAPISAIVRAYSVARTIYRLTDIWKAIQQLDNKVPAEAQISMMMQYIRLIRRGTRWFLRNRRRHLDISSSIKTFASGIEHIKDNIENYLIGKNLKSYQTTYNQYLKLGASETLAKDLACTGALFPALDVIEAVNEYDIAIEDVAGIYYAIGEQLDLGWIRSQVIAHPVENHWESLSREALRDELDWQQRQLTIGILKQPKNGSDRMSLVTNWMKKYDRLIKRWHNMLADLRSSSSLNFTMFFVAVRELLDLTQTSLQSASETEKTVSMSKTSPAKSDSGSSKTKPGTPRKKAS